MAIKILLAEDDLQLIDMYRRKFEMEGFEVQFAEDGQQALDILDKWKPDVALIDIMMPKVNGLDVLKHIKENKDYKDVLTIMLTNLGNESTAEEIYKLGATEYIVKADMTPLEVSEKVKQLIKYYKKDKK
jgi:DNA-binding response OmpR family regulator